MSPRRLGLRILCKNGAPIGGILRSWPTLPLVVRFDLDASWKSKNLPRNIVVALRRPDRVCKLDFDVTSSMAESIVEVIQKPYQALESIGITVKDTTRSSIPVHNAFLGGSSPHLREIKLDGIAFPFPAIRQVLLSTNNLVELHLSKIPNDVYFSPDDLVTGLSTLVRLERLTVGFICHASHAPPSMTRPRQRTILPSLQFLNFHGAIEYLEEFVAQIDVHSFCKMFVKLFNEIFFEIPQFCQFVPRLNDLESPTSRVYVTLSADSVGIVFLPDRSSPANFSLGTTCRRLDWQLSFATQITTQLSPLLSSVHELTIVAGSNIGTAAGEEDVDSTQWLELFQPFTHVTRVTVWKREVAPGIVQALLTEDPLAVGVLPELTELHLDGIRRKPIAMKAAEKFVASRRLSGRTVHLI